MKHTIMLLFVTLVTLPALAVVRVEIKNNPKAATVKREGATCYRGEVGSLIFSGAGGAEYSHQKSVRIQVISPEAKQVIGAIDFAGDDKVGGFALANAKGKTVLICADGSFVL